jgi:hypothetical protein
VADRQYFSSLFHPTETPVFIRSNAPAVFTFFFDRYRDPPTEFLTTIERHQPHHGTKLLGGSVGATVGPDTWEKRKNPSCSSLSPQASHPYYAQISFSRRVKKQATHPF